MGELVVGDKRVSAPLQLRVAFLCFVVVFSQLTKGMQSASTFFQRLMSPRSRVGVLRRSLWVVVWAAVSRLLWRVWRKRRGGSGLHPQSTTPLLLHGGRPATPNRRVRMRNSDRQVVFSKLSEMRRAGEGCDVEMRAVEREAKPDGGREEAKTSATLQRIVESESRVLVHSCVLEAASAEFRKLIDEAGDNWITDGSATRRRRRLVFVQDTSPEALGALVDFIYDGEVFLSDQNIELVLELAIRYSLRPLVEHCCGLLAACVSSATACRVLIVADKLHAEPLRRDTLRYIASHLEEVSADVVQRSYQAGLQALSLDLPATDEATTAEEGASPSRSDSGFSMLTSDLVLEILLSDAVRVSEAWVFLTMAGWLAEQPSACQEQPPSLLPAVHFSRIPPPFLAGFVEPHPIMRSPQAQRLVQEAFRRQALAPSSPPSHSRDKTSMVRARTGPLWKPATRGGSEELLGQVHRLVRDDFAWKVGEVLLFSSVPTVAPGRSDGEGPAAQGRPVEVVPAIPITPTALPEPPVRQRTGSTRSSSGGTTTTETGGGQGASRGGVLASSRAAPSSPLLAALWGE
uniref:BTB domain-containing protein n=1 Tax=Rhizochromulina marina TaxID=1034831 RepID=A0A7S2SU54_9STRA|mmetsp:Transcript_6065/g.17702  ORF Transcript_6065/g.17702 Transcript_6065/m.17702 type:complete len:574 (+) Transcript_6065:181-1902(+)